MVDRVDKPYKDNYKKDDKKDNGRIGLPLSRVRGFIDDLINEDK